MTASQGLEKFKRVLPFYLGQPVFYRSKKIDTYFDWRPLSIEILKLISHNKDIDKIQLQLQSLDSMTEEEYENYPTITEEPQTYKDFMDDVEMGCESFSSDQFLWLLSNGFSLFSDLVEAGYIIIKDK